MDNLLGAVVATGLVKTRHGIQEGLDFGGVEDFYGHGETLYLL
jgi:hypothetical protein